jgi:hypothetical protein
MTEEALKHDWTEEYYGHRCKNEGWGCWPTYVVPLGPTSLARRPVTEDSMGITYGDHLIDSGYCDITPEQERDIEAREERAEMREHAKYLDCPCGGWDCSGIPGGPLPGCPYVRNTE